MISVGVHRLNCQRFRPAIRQHNVVTKAWLSDER